MRDPDWNFMDEREFDALLEDSFQEPPPEQIVAEVTPWKKATKRVLIGIGLTTITLNFWWLNYILPAVGMALMLLGFRALRRENRWLGLCFGIGVFRAVYLYAGLILNSTIWFRTASSSPVLYGLTGLNLALTFVQFFCLWGGFRAVQKKAGLAPHAGSAIALLIWYAITGLLAAVSYNGLILPLGLLVCYLLILRSLWKLSKELDQAGYAVRPAPVGITDGKLAAGIAAILAAGCICGLVLGCRYPMDWQAVDSTEHSGVEAVEAQLLELGVPEDVVNDLTAEDLAACSGALRAVVEVSDETVDDNGEPKLRVTGVGIELPGKRWMIIQHFRWIVDPGFYGTESIQLWPAYQDTLGWRSAGEITGQVLYDKDGETYSAPYWFLGDQAFTSDSIFWGEQARTDVFAAFSMPRSGENHRGYVAYPMEEVRDGYIISSWFNYTHQNTLLQYPAMTAMEFRMSVAWGPNLPFRTIQDALQFYPTEESAELLS